MLKRRQNTSTQMESIYGLTSDTIGRSMPVVPRKTKRTQSKVKTPTSTKSKTTSTKSTRAKTSKRALAAKREERKKALAVKKRPTVVKSDRNVVYIPNLNIQYDKLNLPDSIANLPLDNAVSLSDELLKFVKNKAELRTKNVSTLLLRNIVPSLLACDAGLQYTKVFLEEGFGFEASLDESIQDGLSDVVRLELLYYFIARTKLPKAVKSKLIDQLTEKFADQIIASIKESVAKKKVSDKIKDVEAFVMRTRSDNKVTTSKRPDEEEGSSKRVPGKGTIRRRS